MPQIEQAAAGGPWLFEKQYEEDKELKPVELMRILLQMRFRCAAYPKTSLSEMILIEYNNRLSK